MGNRFESLKKYLDTNIARFGVQGVDLSVWQDHQEIFRHSTGYGDIEKKTPLAPDAIYNLYSATKVITGVAAMQFVERGDIRLLDPLEWYIPEFKNMKIKYGTFAIAPAKNPIRVADLLTMTSGITYDPDTPEIRALIQETGGTFDTLTFAKTIAKMPLLFEPGTGWNYGYNMDVMGAVIEVASGKKFGAYLKEHIFDPLGMTDTMFPRSLSPAQRARRAPQYLYNVETGKAERVGDDPYGCEFPASMHEGGGGQLVSTVRDYSAFVDALACGGTGKTGARILTERSIWLMSQNRLNEAQLLELHRLSASAGFGYGLGVAPAFDPAATCTLVPKGAFYWPGVGGVHNLVDPGNKLSFFMAHNTIFGPVPAIFHGILNVIYAAVG
ncbi:MAG: beta-lactamase family protein [Spirochaetaceae bacterium]|nr:beta-lactamase family protein [Spirochaetaceae bacterium]